MSIQSRATYAKAPNEIVCYIYSVTLQSGRRMAGNWCRQSFNKCIAELVTLDTSEIYGYSQLFVVDIGFPLRLEMLQAPLHKAEISSILKQISFPSSPLQMYCFTTFPVIPSQPQKFYTSFEFVAYHLFRNRPLPVLFRSTSVFLPMTSPYPRKGCACYNRHGGRRACYLLCPLKPQI